MQYRTFSSKVGPLQTTGISLPAGSDAGVKLGLPVLTTYLSPGLQSHTFHKHYIHYNSFLKATSCQFLHGFHIMIQDRSVVYPACPCREVRALPYAPVLITIITGISMDVNSHNSPHTPPKRARAWAPLPQCAGVGWGGICCARYRSDAR